MRSSCGRFSSASTPNPSSAPAPSAAPGAAPPPPAASSSPTMPASQPSLSSAETDPIASSPSTTGPPPMPSSTPSPGLPSPSFLRPPATASSSSPGAPAASPSTTRPRVSMPPLGVQPGTSTSWGCIHIHLPASTGCYCDVATWRCLRTNLAAYVLPLGSDQPPRYIGCPEREVISALFNVPVWAHHSLHWYPLPYLKYETESAQLEDQAEQQLVIVFDTIAESFRQMRAPLASTYSSIFEVDGMLGIYSSNRAKEIVDIWVLQNYESEIWVLKYRVELPLTQIRRKLEARDGDGNWYVIVASGDGDVLLLVRFGHWLFYVDTDGKLVASFQDINFYKYGLKQTLVPHDFFTTREGFAADASPFI
uniref:Uncharacterized protein n=1 Tax=Aegilops tauschii subsp. strangulata TaxID=200361 RepID=A0A453GJA5_AEGTS